jgi:hypothetical protein
MVPPLARLVQQARTPVDGPEKTLLYKAIGNGLLRQRQLDRRVYIEPRMPTGYPDIVIAYSSTRNTCCNPTRKMLKVSHLRVAQQIYHCQGVHFENLCEVLAIPRKHLKSIVSDLMHAGLIWRRGNYLATRSIKDIFPVREIVAVECKVSDWRGALRQAQSNVWFASESYILIPENSTLPSVKEACELSGIGLLVFTGEEVINMQSAKKHPIPSSYGSWIVNEWVVTRVKQNFSWR